jgi:phosphoesterase RecJ-like protein
MSFREPEWQAATNAIQQAQTVLVVTHVSPDGDAIGSALGLANALRAMGKDVTVADDDGVPKFLRWLPQADTIATELKEGSWDVMISTDASDEVRTGNVGAYGRANSNIVINLDHHITNIGFGDIHLVVATAVSAAEVVFDWWEFLGFDWTLDSAVPTLTGMVTDTIGFRTNNVTARTLEIAQALMTHGASLTEITGRVLDVKSWEELNLWKRVFPSIELHGEVVTASISLADFEAVGGADEVSDAGLVSFLNQTRDAMIAVLFKEQADGTVKVSFRAKPGYNVSDVALSLGGGGHKLASGATVDGNLEEAQAKVMPLAHAATKAGQLQIG